MRQHKTATLLLMLLACGTAAHGQAADEWNAAAETLVVFNPDFPGSAGLAAHYAEKRGIPKERVLSLRCSQENSISRAEFDSQLRGPLLEEFQKNGWLGGKPPPPEGAAGIVRVLVLMRGVPFQIRREAASPRQSQEDEASVDSELTVLGLTKPPAQGGLRNPYFDQPERFPQSARSAGMLIVGRLDGPDDATVRRMIDDALAAEAEGLLGRAVIDLALKNGAYQEGEDWLTRSAESFAQAGIPVFVDRSAEVIGEAWPLPDTALYFGWYTDRITGALASPDFRFKRGAIACHLHSFSASVIRTHEQAWAGPLLSKGAAVTFGNVFEPYLSLTVHFDILNKRLLEGFTVGEAAWNATPALSWMNVVLGDPLYRPFGKDTGGRLGEGDDRDHALYRGLARRMAAGSSEAEVKAALADLAAKRRSHHLLELTALLSALRQRHAEAARLLEHAESFSPEAADLLRLRLYQVEMLRGGQQFKEARELLLQTLKDARFRDLPALKAGRTLLKSLGG